MEEGILSSNANECKKKKRDKSVSRGRPFEKYWLKMSPFYLVDAVLRAEVPGRQVGSHGQVLLVSDDSAVPEQGQPRRAHCGGEEKMCSATSQIQASNKQSL